MSSEHIKLIVSFVAMIVVTIFFLLTIQKNIFEEDQKYIIGPIDYTQRATGYIESDGCVEYWGTFRMKKYKKKVCGEYSISNNPNYKGK